MIVHTLCNTCFQVYELRIEIADVALLKQLVPEGLLCQCPRLCGGNIMVAENPEVAKLAQDPRLKAPLSITVQELFKAVKGGGLPDEIPRSFELGVALFKSEKVKSVFMEQDGNDIYLHEVRFENGAVLHLGLGRRGAQVVKITKGA